MSFFWFFLIFDRLAQVVQLYPGVANGSVYAYLRTYRSIHGCFFHTTPFSCRHDSRNRTAHDSGHIAVSGTQSGIHFLPANSVPAALPATIS